jgi:energy-coupling factor transport system ATP-binding protein
LEERPVKVSLSGIEKSYGGWKCAAGAVFAPGVHLITGRVGSGKSTLALLAARVIKPDKGIVQYEGIHTHTLSFQYPENHVTGSTLEEEALSYGVEPDHALGLAGITAEKTLDPFRLSRGELKAFHLACLLLRPWDLLILDEPFSALDCRGKMAVSRHISERKEEIILVCTHEQHFLPRTDFLWEMRSGLLTYLGEIPEAIPSWQSATGPVRSLRAQGILPANLTWQDIREAVCRIHD